MIVSHLLRLCVRLERATGTPRFRWYRIEASVGAQTTEETSFLGCVLCAKHYVRHFIAMNSNLRKIPLWKILLPPMCR